ncbi:MAG: hypothetical protein ACTHYM_02765 [Actinomycetaceae bacterium]
MTGALRLLLAIAVLGGAFLGAVVAAPAHAAPVAAEVPSGDGTGSPSAGTLEPDPALAGLLTVTPSVEQWFDVEAEAVARSAADTVLAEAVAGRADEIVVGDPRPVLGWSDDLVEASFDGPFVSPTSSAVAPVLLDGAAIGVVVLETRNDSFEGELRAVAGLPAALLELDPGVAVVHDPRTDAWYGYSHERVRPLDDSARSMLAGTVDIVDYRPFLLDPEAGTDAPGESDGAVRWVVVGGVVAVGLVLLAAGISVWMRVPEAEAETEERPRPPRESLRARVRAELRNGRPGSWNHRG